MVMVATPSTPASKRQRATPASTPGGPKSREEKILVTVRARPLSRREQAMYDLIAWEFADDHTIIFQNPNHERTANSFTFDRVFDPTSSTQKVYEEGAKDVALSALTGIHATIFAYGQTSSGKTFTMKGITENAVEDIYAHIEKSMERDFVLKLSALEIYNETVIDLLNRESGPLRLLDDPEKGTIVEKLNEEVVQDSQHLRHLISVCEAQRQVGETSLNDKSSRSHQIIKLTIQSNVRESSGRVKSLIATLNLVDLAGSERASQTNADGTRLKEGIHINRSLLTLTTVIRKLSGGRKSGHIPYRDSKLTRILQHSLGGNARTAIICTVSPALSHLEQTGNTLSFATNAKEVTNNAQVNMVVSDKTLVKHLQKEVARLEAELRSPEPSSFKSLLMEKDLKIQQMEREMKELKRQRDIAESKLKLERCAKKGPKVARCLSYSVENESAVSGNPSPKVLSKGAAMRQSVASVDPSMLVHEIRKLEHRQKQLSEEANHTLEVLHKEVAAHNLGNQETTETIAKLLSEIKDMQVSHYIPEETRLRNKADLREEIFRLNAQENSIESLEKKLENVQKSIDMLISSFSGEETTEFNKKPLRKKKILPSTLSNNANMQNIIRPPCSPLSSSSQKDETENKVPESNEFVSRVTPRSVRTTPSKLVDGSCSNISSREGTLAGHRQENSVNVKKIQRMFKNAAEENIRSIRTYITELKERVAKLQYQKQLLVCQVLELEEANEASTDEMETDDHQSPLPWHLMFEHQRKQIIMLWHLCHVSIIHRTQFYLLFKGDPADQIYMEVELRRLTWLEQNLAELGNASPALLGDDPASTVSSSIKALKDEREYLAKRVNLKLMVEERELLYTKWDVPAVGKQRRLQLVIKLWTDPLNMQHVKESAEIVAKLVGFCESGEHASKEMFELNFVNPNDKKTWMGWNLISNLLRL